MRQNKLSEAQKKSFFCTYLSCFFLGRSKEVGFKRVGQLDVE
jgi:hypothetical protein|tara:strand:- start:1023 stop:1148 length:126 start_codon:yes stop_codon:yes gene_type:complete